MSHVATAWAFSMRHLKPATKIVLLTLADCQNPAYGCFPGQEYIADACEMSERSVRDHLTKLEDLGLISQIKALGFNYAHGFAFSRPVDAAEAGRLIMK